MRALAKFPSRSWALLSTLLLVLYAHQQWWFVPGSAVRTHDGSRSSAATIADSGQLPGQGAHLQLVYRGWIGFANIGDDIVEDIFFELLAGSLRRELPELSGVSFKVRKHKAITVPLAEHDLFVLGGGSLLDLEYMSFVRDGLDAGKPVYLHGTGYQYGGGQHDLFSDGVDPTAVLGGTRGPMSQARVLDELKIKVPMVYDSALAALELFGANASSATAAMISDKRKALGGKVVVIVGTHVSNMEKWKDDFRKKTLDFLEAWAGVCARLSSNDGEGAVVVVLLDLDGFAAPQNQFLLDRCLALGGTAANVVHPHFTEKWPEFLATLQAADVTLSARLHSGILSAAVGTPFAFFPSPGMTVKAKYDDFERSIGWSTTELFGAPRVDAEYARHVIGVAHSHSARLRASLLAHAGRCLRAHTMAVDRAVAEVLRRRSEWAEALRQQLQMRGKRWLAFKCAQVVKLGVLSCAGGVETKRQEFDEHAD